MEMRRRRRSMGRRRRRRRRLHGGREEGREEQQREGVKKQAVMRENLCDLFTEKQKIVILTDCSPACSFN